MPVFLLFFNFRKEVIKMFSKSTFKSLTVSDLVEQIEKDIVEYATNNDSKILEDISACILEARHILNNSLEKADPANTERITDIEKKHQALDGIEKRFKTLKEV
jgi:hypothetical protein